MIRCALCNQRRLFHRHPTHLFCSPETVAVFDSFIAILLQFEADGVEFPPEMKARIQDVLTKFNRLGLNPKVMIDGETP